MASLSLNLSKKQQHSLALLREAMRDVDREECRCDNYLLRWLKARNFNASIAESMLRTHLEWRQSNNIDNIAEWFKCPEAITRYYPGGFCGHDREGRPLYIDPIGKSDPKGLLQSATFDELLNSRIALIEDVYRRILPQQSERLGCTVYQTTVIFDVEGFGLRHLNKNMLDFQLAYARLAEANYPESMHSAFIINVPPIFWMAYNIVKQVLNEATVNKFRMLGQDYRTELLKYFDPKYLPVRYGGELCDSNDDPDCKEWVSYGGDVPDDLYLKVSNPLELITVARKGVFSVSLLVKLEDLSAADSAMTLRWEFISEDYDISYAVYCLTKVLCHKKKRPIIEDLIDDVIVDNHRVNSHFAREAGQHVCCKPGLYVLYFDNLYSSMRSKKVHYYFGIQ